MLNETLMPRSGAIHANYWAGLGAILGPLAANFGCGRVACPDLWAPRLSRSLKPDGNDDDPADQP
jgi:hypothetical protein